MTIGQIAKQSGISKDAIRYYTTRGLIRGSVKTAGSREYAEYDSEIIKQIHTIKNIQNLGFTLAEIKTLLDEVTVEPGCKLSLKQLKLLNAKLHEIARKQEQLTELSDFIQTRIKKLS